MRKRRRRVRTSSTRELEELGLQKVGQALACTGFGADSSEKKSRAGARLAPAHRPNRSHQSFPTKNLYLLDYRKTQQSHLRFIYGILSMISCTLSAASLPSDAGGKESFIWHFRGTLDHRRQARDDPGADLENRLDCGLEWTVYLLDLPRHLGHSLEGRFEALGDAVDSFVIIVAQASVFEAGSTLPCPWTRLGHLQSSAFLH